MRREWSPEELIESWTLLGQDWTLVGNNLNGRWIKAAPIFNTLLCAVYGLEVLRFNPSMDSIRQPYRAGTRMQYQGSERRYADPTMTELVDAIAAKHPRMVTASGRTPTSRQLTDSSSSSTGKAAHHVDG